MESLEEYMGRGLGAAHHSPIDDRTTIVIAIQHEDDESGQENWIAQRAAAYLEAEDLRVVIAEDSDHIAREGKAAAVIGICRGEEESGLGVWFDSGSAASRELAETVYSRLSWSGQAARSRGVYEDDKAWLTGVSGTPTVLLETAGGQDREQVAKSIADGVVAHLGIRKMYLTFDDGPSAKNTPQVLEILRQKGVKATFFVIGEMAEANPDLLKQIVDEGHAIGIHSYSHNYRELYASVESFVDDFYRTQLVVKEITGIEPVIYRFPGGSINHYNKEVYEAIIEEMEMRGFVHYDWNISSDDALGRVQPGELMRGIKAAPRPRAIVLLMHDAYANIVGELDEIIEYYADYQMNVIDEDTVPVQF